MGTALLAPASQWHHLWTSTLRLLKIHLSKFSPSVTNASSNDSAPYLGSSDPISYNFSR